jgi:hypothetical protein
VLEVQISRQEGQLFSSNQHRVPSNVPRLASAILQGIFSNIPCLAIKVKSRGRLAKQIQCNDEKPCDSCPKRSNPPSVTPWRAVGCKRGSLGEEMEPVDLCPQSQIEKPSIQRLSQRNLLNFSGGISITDEVMLTNCISHNETSEEDRCRSSLSSTRAHHDSSSETTSLKASENADTEQMGQNFLDKAIERRQKDISNEFIFGGNQTTILGRVLRTLKGNPLGEDLGMSQCLASLIPLDEYILAIIWELLDQPECLSSLSLFDKQSDTTLTNFAILMRSAAFHQAKLEDV